MATVIRVSPDKLKSSANAFNSTGQQIKNLTNNMTSTVQALTGRVWSGEAATAYTTKFNGLQDDINKMTKMITECVNDLNTIAQEYESSTNDAKAQASSLSSDVIV